MQNKVRQRLVPLFAEELDERLRRQRLAKLVRRQSVLRENIVELIDN